MRTRPRCSSGTACWLAERLCRPVAELLLAPCGAPAARTSHLVHSLALMTTLSHTARLLLVPVIVPLASAACQPARPLPRPMPQPVDAAPVRRVEAAAVVADSTPA